MRILLDLNVVLDVLLTRHDHLEASEILSLGRTGAVEAFVPAHGITTIYYLLRKRFGDAESRDQIAQVLEMVKPAVPNATLFDTALRSSLPDYEDAVVVETALLIGAEYIVTRNSKHFTGSKIPFGTAPEFMARFTTTWGDGGCVTSG